MDVLTSFFSFDFLTDTEGRPLREQAAPPRLQAAVPMDLKTCPYKGSRHRHEHPMNVSALHQMVNHWPDLLETLAYCREQYAASKTDETWTFLDMWRVCSFCETLPLYLHRRVESAVPNGEIPPPIAGLYKIIGGVGNVFFDMARRHILSGGQLVAEPGDIDGLIDYVEENGLLIGRRQVCAGPTPHLRTVLDVMLRGVPALPVAVSRKAFAGREVELRAPNATPLAGRLVTLDRTGCRVRCTEAARVGAQVELHMADVTATSLGVVTDMEDDVAVLMWVEAPPSLQSELPARSLDSVLAGAKVAQLIDDPKSHRTFAYAAMNFVVLWRIQELLYQVMALELRNILARAQPACASLLLPDAPFEIAALASLDRQSRTHVCRLLLDQFASPSSEALDPELSALIDTLTGHLVADETRPDVAAALSELRLPGMFDAVRPEIADCLRSYLGVQDTYRQIARYFKQTVRDALGPADAPDPIAGLAGTTYQAPREDPVQAILSSLLGCEVSIGETIRVSGIEIAMSESPAGSQ